MNHHVLYHDVGSSWSNTHIVGILMCVCMCVCVHVCACTCVCVRIEQEERYELREEEHCGTAPS